MKVWMYYETDGDSGYYGITLFKYKERAEQQSKKVNKGYGNVEEIEINEEQMSIYEETLCPDCNGPMISRTGKFGVFWGCKKFPECKGTRDSSGKSKGDRAKERAFKEGEGAMYEDDKGIMNIVEDKDVEDSKTTFTKNYDGEKFSFNRRPR